ncbi:hypothetical protein RN001_003803 [Aquatica leii]|uniref:Intraflagellar transport protein 43 homolog n=1 Tax=Aquatica leii TaxID=1421715 RepID=A0AAN7PIV3_9COLE|nr:hypothetical protein RN001_003803 [Aquatica leii]
MNWDEEIDLLVEKKSPPKQGRRAFAISSPETTEDLLDNALDSISNVSLHDPSFRPRKSSGWADDGVKSKGKTVEDERFNSQTEINFDKDDDDIPVIPDIEELQDDLLGPAEVKAPPILINSSTYKELDEELSLAENASSEFFYLSKMNDIDLSLLTEALCPEEDVKEVDEEWTLESLINDFISVNTQT